MTDFTQHHPATSSNFWPANLGVHIFHIFPQWTNVARVYHLVPQSIMFVWSNTKIIPSIWVYFIIFLQQGHSCMCMHGGVGGTAHISKNCNCLLLMVASRQFLTYCPSFLYFSLYSVSILTICCQSYFDHIFMHIFFCRFFGKISISIRLGVDRVHTK